MAKKKKTTPQDTDKIYIGGLHTAERIDDIIDIMDGLETPDTVTRPTHILTASQTDGAFYVSFDGVHIFKAESKEQVLELSKHDINYINCRFTADEENSRQFIDLLTTLQKNSDIATHIAPDEYTPDGKSNPAFLTKLHKVYNCETEPTELFNNIPPISQDAAQLAEIPRVISAAPEKVNYPIDKINKTVWDDLASLPKNNAGQIAFATEKRGSSNPATVLYSIDFENLEKIEGLKLTKSLTAFDKRVFIAVSAIYAQKVEFTTTGQIYTAMGGSGKPNLKQKEKINESLTKMGAARVYLDNTLETSVNKKYDLFKYDGDLLPFERVSAYINNTLVDSAIHIFREPPLMTFARERKQITTITRKLLEIPISQTEDNLQITDYLIERIAAMKRPGNNLNHKILYKTVFEKCKMDGKSNKDRTSRSRTPDKIKKCLDHFQQQGFIKGYKQIKDGVEIEI